MATTCLYCALEHGPESLLCERCGAQLPVSAIERLVDLEQDRAECPSCHGVNTTSAEYCTRCGTPMAVITRALDLVRHHERGPLETWRVYGIETQMVARDEELERLFALQRRTDQERRALCVTIEARTGLGKSRLLAEFHRRLDQTFSEALLVTATCQEATHGALHMFAQWLKARFYIAEREPLAVARRKLEEALGAILGKERGDRIERVFEPLAHLMGFSPLGDGEEKNDADEAEPETDRSSGAISDRRCFEAVAEVLRADAARAPLVIALEDLQYASAQSLKLIEHLREHLLEAPILMWLSFNPEELSADSPLRDERFKPDERIELEPLSDEQVDRFVRQTLHKVDPLPARLIERITESAHGNPLAVEEMMRLLIGERAIDTRQEPWRVEAEKLSALKLPQTVEAAVRARLEALDEPERELLRMAATIGDRFWPKLLVSLWRSRRARLGESDPQRWRDQEDASRIEALLESLERKDIIRRREDSMLGDLEELYFKHRLERRAIHEATPAETRRLDHALIAQWLERRPEGSALIEIVARHFDQAGCSERASACYIKAADRARTRYANREAIALYALGLSATSEAQMDLKIQAFHNLGGVHDLLGEYDRSLAYYRELLRYAWLLDDPRKAGVALHKIGRAYRNLSEFEEALDCLNGALEHFERAEDRVGVASTLDDMGKVYWIRGEYEEALRRYRAGLLLRREQGKERSVALSLDHIGSVLLERGELREAKSCFSEALSLRRLAHDRQGLAESFNSLGVLCMERGDYEQAATLFEEALGIVEELGYRAMEGIVLNNLGEAQRELGDHERALALLERAYDVAEEAGEKRLLFDIMRNFGQSHLVAMARTQALAHLIEALDFAKAIQAKALIAIGHQSVAELHARYVFDSELGEQSVAEAEAHYERAIALLEAIQGASQLGRCASSYGRFLIESSRPARGRQQLERAQEIFKRLEMRKLWEANQRLIAAL